MLTSWHLGREDLAAGLGWVSPARVCTWPREDPWALFILVARFSGRAFQEQKSLEGRGKLQAFYDPISEIGLCW